MSELQTFWPIYSAEELDRALPDAATDRHQLLSRLRQENERLRRAVEFCLSHGAKLSRFDTCVDLFDRFNDPLEVPAEFADIIRSKS